MPVQVLIWGPSAILSTIITQTVSREPDFMVTTPNINAMTLLQAIEACGPDVIVTTIQSREVEGTCREFLSGRDLGAVLTVTDDGRKATLSSSGADPTPLQEVSVESLVEAIRQVVGGGADD